MDYKRYKYYDEHMRKGKPEMTQAQMLDKWCVKNDEVTSTAKGEKAGRYYYSCKSPEFPYSDIFSSDSQAIIHEEYDRAYAIRKEQDSYLTIEHDAAINYEATLEKMFSEDAIITFPMVTWGSKANTDFRAYNEMCHHGADFDKSRIDVAQAKVYSWLIELTGDQQTLDQFQIMEPNGWTHISSGLIRSVPVMMKGVNKRKIFVLLSDGDDSANPKKVTQKWLETHKLCEKIEQGFLARPETNTSAVEIYYIATTAGASRVKYWAENCTGEKRATTSTKREELIKLIKNIMNDEVGRFT